jgi:hypothetical protein
LPAKIADRRAKDLCFRCDGKFVPRHKEECKRLFIIEVIGDEEEDEDPTISVHALTGIQPCTSTTMQVMVHIGAILLRALLDFGSTHNFIDTLVATCAGIVFQGGTCLRVAVASGDRVTSMGRCANLTIDIVGEPFVLTCYGLALGSFDMVLNMQWLESLGPVLWDFRGCTLAFICNNRRVLWSATSTSAAPATLASISTDVMEDLLQQYEGLFVAPTGLPPDRQHCHRIYL